MKVSGLLGLAFMLALTSFSALTVTDTRVLVDKVVGAYGGSKLINLRSLRVVDKYHAFHDGQSVSASEIEVTRNTAEVVIDFANKRKNFRLIMGETQDKENVYSQHQMFDGKYGYRLNYEDNSYQLNDFVSFTGADRRRIFTLDTRIVMLMDKAKQTVSHVGEQYLKGRAHQLLKFEAKGYPEMIVFVDAESHVISRLQLNGRSAGQYFWYNYSNHQRIGGILYAENSYVSHGGAADSVSVARNVQFNLDVDEYFVIPSGYKQEDKALDFAEMSVKKLSDNVYLVGQDWGFSVFADVGDYFVGSGGYYDLQKRFESIQKHLHSTKPLKYQIVSHHHDDHLSGMKEAEQMGVKFVLVAEHIPLVKQAAETEIAPERLVIVDGKLELAGGKVTVLNVPNGHSSHNLVAYFSEAKTVLTADMYLSRAKSGAPKGYESLETLKQRLAWAKLDVQHFAAAHSGRVLSLDDFNYSLKNRSSGRCPETWVICAEYY